MAKEALQLFLRSLSEGNKFNIVSFGDSFQFMFDKTEYYNEKTLEESS